MRRFCLVCLALSLTCLSAQAQSPHPRDSAIHDADTRAWWHTTEALSGDSMEGRDTGTAAYERAAEAVAQRFAQAGLKAAGENGNFRQDVPMHEVDVVPEQTSFLVHRAGKPDLPLRFLHEITTSAAAMSFNAPLVFRGYCGADVMTDVKGKIVLCFGTQRQGLPSGSERTANAARAGALTTVTVDDPYFTIEPPRWPYAYARAVTLRNPAEHRGPTATAPALRISDAAFINLLEGTGQNATVILKAGGTKQPLPSFDLPGYTLEAHITTTTKDISSPNILAVLPGSDPALRDEYVVVAAHLDGYGFGTPVLGDNLYNGTLDDAAYVALLIQMADDIKAGTLAPPKRSVFFCAFTGEEKGLLGSTWFVQHPTVPLAQIAADINLDQLRPLFPLHILTALAIHDTTLGTTAKQVGAGMGIELREDREPERGLLRRADHYPFLKAGVPAIGFIFGFNPGTDAEQRYRHWYQVQYHRPQDDLTQPVDFDAAAKFDSFIYKLTEAVADDPQRPRILPGSSFTPTTTP